MNRHDNRKKKLMISYDNLSEELKELFKETYPEGHKDHMQKIVKPDGTPIFVVPMETEETSYMVKFEARIDSHFAEEELDKELFSDDTKDDEKFEPLPDESSEKNSEHKEFILNHGSYDNAYDIKLEDEFDIDDDEEEEKDDYVDDDDDDEEDDNEEYVNDYDDEPNDADILDIEENYLLNDPTLQQSKSKKAAAEKKPRASKAKSEKTPKVSKPKAAKEPKKATKTTVKKETTAKTTKTTKAKKTEKTK